jgi:hypothetical protein
MKEAAERIKGLIDIQKQNGNYNCNEYMYGMLVGLECAYYTLLGEEGKFTERPKEWLDDNIPKDFVPTVAEQKATAAELLEKWEDAINGKVSDDDLGSLNFIEPELYKPLDTSS